MTLQGILWSSQCQSDATRSRSNTNKRKIMKYWLCRSSALTLIDLCQLARSPAKWRHKCQKCILFKVLLLQIKLTHSTESGIRPRSRTRTDFVLLVKKIYFHIVFPGLVNTMFCMLSLSLSLSLSLYYMFTSYILTATKIWLGHQPFKTHYSSSRSNTYNLIDITFYKYGKFNDQSKIWLGNCFRLTTPSSNSWCLSLNRKSARSAGKHGTATGSASKTTTRTRPNAPWSAHSLTKTVSNNGSVPWSRQTQRLIFCFFLFFYVPS